MKHRVYAKHACYVFTRHLSIRQMSFLRERPLVVTLTSHRDYYSDSYADKCSMYTQFNISSQALEISQNL